MKIFDINQNNAATALADTDYEVRSAAIRRASLTGGLSPAQIDMLLRDVNPNVVQTTAKYCNLTPEQKTAVLAGGDLYSALAVIKRGNLTPEQFGQALASTSPEVREAALRLPGVPDLYYQKGLTDPSSVVRAAAYEKTPVLSDEQRVAGLADPSNLVRLQAVRRGGMTSTQQSIALADTDPAVVGAAVRQGGLNADQTLIAITHFSATVRVEAFRVCTLSADMLARGLSDSDPMVRYAALKRGGLTPLQLNDFMASEATPFVRDAALLAKLTS